MSKKTFNQTKSDNSKSRNKSKKDARFPKANQPCSKVDDSREKTGTNPFDWHVRNPEILNDLGKLNFNYALGSPLPLGSSTTDPQGGGDGRVLPGILAVHFLPTMGISNGDGIDEGLSMAATQLFAYMRKHNAGATNYDAQDPLMYIGAMDSVHMLYSYLVRAYGLLNYFSQRNQYDAPMVFAAMRLDYDDFIANAANFKFWLDHIAAQINARSLPASLSLTKYHTFRVSGFYKDNMDDAKAQVYFYVPECFYKYEGYASAKGGKLTPKWFCTPYEETNTIPLWTFTKVKELMEEMLEAILTDQDFTIIWGDMLKAYGEENMYTVPHISSDYTVVPVYDPIESLTLSNTFCVGRPSTTLISDEELLADIYAIRQDPEGEGVQGGAILYTPKLYSHNIVTNNNKIFNPLGAVPDTRLMVDAMRNICVWDESAIYNRGTTAVNGQRWEYKIVACGSVLPTSFNIIKLSAAGNWQEYVTGSCVNVSNAVNYLPVLWMTNIGNHPTMYLNQVSNTVEESNVQRAVAASVQAVIGDIRQGAVMPKEYQKRYLITTNFTELGVTD